MTSGERAYEGMPNPGPDAGLAGRKIPGIFIQSEGADIGDGLADAVVSKVAPVASREGVPPLPPLLRRVHPLLDGGAGRLSHQRERAHGIEDEFAEALAARGEGGRDRPHQVENLI